MLPQIGPGTFFQAPLASTVTARAEQGAPPGTGETAAARIRPETAERVDPPRPPLTYFPIPEETRRTPRDIIPPDPEAPSGPPPAFEATPLERERERARAPAGSAVAETPEAPPDGMENPSAQTPPAVTERAAADLAEVRRLSAPESAKRVDVTR